MDLGHPAFDIENLGLGTLDIGPWAWDFEPCALNLRALGLYAVAPHALKLKLQACILRATVGSTSRLLRDDRSES